MWKWKLDSQTSIEHVVEYQVDNITSDIHIQAITNIYGKKSGGANAPPCPPVIPPMHGAVYLQYCKTGFASHVTEMMIFKPAP